MMRRLALTAVASLAALSAAAPAASAASAPPAAVVPAAPPERRRGDTAHRGRRRVGEPGGGRQVRAGVRAGQGKPPGRGAGVRAAGSAGGGGDGPLRAGSPGRDVYAAVRRGSHRPGHRHLARPPRRRLVPADQRVRDRPVERSAAGPAERAVTGPEARRRLATVRDATRSRTTYASNLGESSPSSAAPRPSLPLDSFSDSLRPEGQDGAAVGKVQ